MARTYIINVSMPTKRDPDYAPYVGVSSGRGARRTEENPNHARTFATLEEAEREAAVWRKHGYDPVIIGWF